MLRKVGRLFTIKTRFEAWLVIYAIALGAVERGRLYLETYPGIWRLDACAGLHGRRVPRRGQAARFGDARRNRPQRRSLCGSAKTASAYWS